MKANTDNSSGFIYIITSPLLLAAKVGKTVNRNGIIGRYTTPYGNNLKVYTFASGDIHIAEKKAHFLLRDYHISGELFDVSHIEIIIKTCRIVTGDTDHQIIDYEGRKRIFMNPTACKEILIENNDINVDDLPSEDNEPCTENSNIMSKNLAEYYNISQKDITDKFRKNYDTPRSRKVFYYLNAIKNIRPRNILINSDEDDKLFEIYPDTTKILLTISIINIVFGEICKDFIEFSGRHIHRTILEPRLDEIIQLLIKKINLIAVLFDMRKSKYLNIMKGNTKQKLAFINIILKSTFDIKIVIDKHSATNGGKRDMFYLVPSDLFYAGEDKIWKAKVK